MPPSLACQPSSRVRGWPGGAPDAGPFRGASISTPSGHRCLDSFPIGRLRSCIRLAAEKSTTISRAPKRACRADSPAGRVAIPCPGTARVGGTSGGTGLGQCLTSVPSGHASGNSSHHEGCTTFLAPVVQEHLGTKDRFSLGDRVAFAGEPASPGRLAVVVHRRVPAFFRQRLSPGLHFCRPPALSGEEIVGHPGLSSLVTESTRLRGSSFPGIQEVRSMIPAIPDCIAGPSTCQYHDTQIGRAHV